MKKKKWIEKLGFKIVTKYALDKRFLRFSKEQKILEELGTLNSSVENVELLYREYLGRKVVFFLLGGIILLIFGVGILFLSNENQEIVENTILRNEYGGLEKGVTLIAKSEGLEEEITFSIEPQHYAKEQLDNMAEEVYSYLETNVLPQMDSKEDYYLVRENMNFPVEITGYPFSIMWECSNYNVLNQDGSIVEGDWEKGEEVIVTAKLSCYEYQWEREYLLLVFPLELSWEKSFSKEVMESIEEQDKATTQSSEFVLPEEVNGHRITYEKAKNKTYIFLLFLLAAGLFLTSFLMDNRLSQQMENRNRELLCDYAKLVSKLSLYLGAGLSLRIALIKIVESSDKSRFYVRELERMVHEMENGVSENKVMEGLSERCRLPCYIKLSVLINQNLCKGNNRLCEQLRIEADNAFEERKNLARKYGEEAGTKLLFPMVLMLVVVMIIIMYPAFVSFTA